MATPTFQGAGTPSTVGTPVAPVCAAGDLLVLTVGAISFSGEGPATPAGWTLVASNDGTGGSALKLRRWVKQATADDSEATVTVGGTGVAVICNYRNAYGVEQTGTNGFTTGGGATTMTASTVTTVRPNQLIDEAWMWIEGSDGGSTTVEASTVPTTQRVNRDYNVSSPVPGLLICTQPQTVPGTTPARVAELSDLGYWLSATISIYPNDPPNAPTLGSPADGSTVNVDAPQLFRWLFSDPDPADLQTAYQIRYSSDDGATWAILTSGGSLMSVTVAAGTFADGTDYQWQVRTTDRYGATGPWSAAFHFTGSSTPDVPTITAPVSDATVTEPTVDVTWTFGSQQAYQVRLVADDGTGSPDTGTVLYDTGQIDDVVTHTVTVPLDTTGVTVHAQVSAKAAGIWSDFADVRFTVDFNPPPAPTLTLTTNDQAAAITVYLTNPEPTGDQLDTLYNDLLISADGAETWARYATLLPPNAQWTFRTPASGVDYQFRAVAYTAAGTFAYSDWVDEATVDMGAPAVAPDLIPEGSP